MITNTDTEHTYTCNGSVVNFAIPFQFLEGEETVIKVLLLDTIAGTAVYLVLNTDYTLNNPATIVTTLTAYGATYQIKVKRESPLTNEAEFQPGPFPAESVEEEFDRLVMLIQELNSKLSKFVYLPEGYPLASLAFPLPSANKFIGWNAGATALENKDPLDIAQIQTDITTLQGQVAALISDVNALEASQATQDGDISSLQADVSSIQSDISTIQSDLTALGAAIADFPADIQDLQDQIDALSDQAAAVADHETRIDVLEAYKTQNIQDMAELTTRVSQLEASSPISEFSGSKALANNQSVPIAIADANTPANDFKRSAYGTQLARVTIQIDRRTDDELRYTHVSLLMRFISETQLWYITRENTTAFIGEPDGVEFSIVTDAGTLVGQVYYATDNMPGANYTGVVKFIGKEIPTGV